MKEFFATPTPARPRIVPAEPNMHGRRSPEPSTTSSLFARLAVYDDLAAAPRVHDITSSDVGEFIGRLASETFSLARDAGGDVPYTVIREIVENLIHADFRECVVSIMPGGQEIRFADQGPGIADKDLATLPGYTTATAAMKRHIRGVGSGFPIVREFLSARDGELVITDNLGVGTVVTLLSRTSKPGDVPPYSVDPSSVEHESVSAHVNPELTRPRLTTRQQKVLSLIMEYGDAGPSIVSKELAVGLSTAHRDLAFLESLGLIASDESGKRHLTESGGVYLGTIFG